LSAQQCAPLVRLPLGEDPALFNLLTLGGILVFSTKLKLIYRYFYLFLVQIYGKKINIPNKKYL
jgi:hypothetical protein